MTNCLKLCWCWKLTSSLCEDEVVLLHLKNSCLSSSCMLFMWTITVNCQWFVRPILFAAIIQNFEIGGIAFHILLKKYLKYLNTSLGAVLYLKVFHKVFKHSGQSICANTALIPHKLAVCRSARIANICGQICDIHNSFFTNMQNILRCIHLYPVCVYT